MNHEISKNLALIVVDAQNDFCPGGSLAVTGGDEIILPLNRLIKIFRQHTQPIFVSRDWHHRDNTAHIGPGHWPIHCISGTYGAEFHPRLDIEDAIIISKGQGKLDDGYSAFEGRRANGRQLNDMLWARGVNTLIVGGLATDYCVRATVLDALKLGFDVRIPIDTIRAVNLSPGDGNRALADMQRRGAIITTTSAILNLKNEYESSKCYTNS